MSVRAEVRTASHADALTVPIQAVVERAGEKGGKERKVIFVVDAGKARQRPVATGLSDETHVELASGVKPGEQVITGPYRILRDLKEGDPVQISQTSEDEDRKGGKDAAGKDADKKDEDN